MSNLESERTGIAFQVFGVVWFLLAGVAQAVWDAFVNPVLLPDPAFCGGAAVFIWILGRKERRRARDHHAFMQDHRRFMAGHDQQGKAMWS